MRTWPQLLGTRATRALAVLMLLVAACLRWALMPHPVVLVGPASMTVAVARASQDRTIGYYGLLDGLLILDAAVLVAIGAV